ncbi:tRNA1(Val) (adenine(37)-N6)-methyltransferase [Zobellella maritima]|uniref:tRNA1(Val) (adenine(37)-N6)-methyltransferase n=1 Tax=Zobellella maritima TaxID=2059725 RepID=UPI000E304889|nr:methyltransferase [Zobellella maritima]
MAGRGFTFKQFHINHDQCAMKVGTDGILLGAWTPLGGARRILDVGTGSGLVALMLAQRGGARAHITGIELDARAAAQARDNVAASPWPDRVEIVTGDLQSYQAAPFELIVSNPPYFSHGQSFDCAARAGARHTGSLDYPSLFQHCNRLLAEDGRLSLVLPYQALDDALALAEVNGLHLIEKQNVITRSGKPPRRFLLHLSRVKGCLFEDCMVINSANGGQGETFTKMVSPFYLKM